MSFRNARFRAASQSRSDNHELTFVRPARVHRCRVDHSCVSAPATGETPKLVPGIFAAERSRSTADNCFADFRLQFVSLHRGGVLVLDQLDGAMEITQCRKASETARSMATIISAEKGYGREISVIRRLDRGSPGSYSEARRNAEDGADRAVGTNFEIGQ